MKYFKLFLTVCAMAVAISASAQSKTTAKSKTATSTAKTTTAAPAKKATTTAKTTTAKPAAAAPKAAAKPATTTKTTTTTKAAAKPAKETTSYAAADYDRGYHMLIETKVGGASGSGAWGANIALEHEFNKYIAWDLFNIGYTTNFGFDSHILGLKSGVKGFSPVFWNACKMRGYASLALGYACQITPNMPELDEFGWPTGEETTDVSHGFGLAWGAGVQMFNHLYVGYELEWNTISKSCIHFAKIGYRF